MFSAKTTVQLRFLLLIVVGLSLTAVAQAPQGYLNSAVNASNGTTSVPQNGQLQVSGWAQAQGGATLSKIVVTIDGSPIGNATLGPGTSWSLTYNIGMLSGGSHWASATAYDSNNASTTLSWSSAGAGSFTVVTAAGPPQGYLNSAVNASNGTTSVPQNGQLQVSGWAQAQGTATLSRVAVTIDGNPIGNATLGPGTSWSLTYNIGMLSGGSHWASATAYDSNNASTTLSWSSGTAGSFTVVTASGPPQGYLNSAVNASDGTTSVPQNGQLKVSGWAAAQGTATLTRVAVTVDGSPAGNATLGPGTSWSLTYNIGTLSAGSHWASATAYDSNNASTTLSWSSGTAGSFTVVTASGPPQGYLNSAVNASDGTTSVPQNGQLQVSGWAQAQGTATLSKVVVTVDGNPAGNATLGPGTSWSLTYNIGTLSAGSHWASAVAYDSNNASTTLSWSSGTAGSFTVVTASGPLTISTSSVPNMVQGTAYSSVNLQSNGGNGTITWSLAPGSDPPPGINLSSSGALSGTPTLEGLFPIMVQAVDSSTPVPETATQPFYLNVAAVPNVVSRLSGQYAFELQGYDSSDNVYTAMAGSFTANGASGLVTGGIVDVSVDIGGGPANQIGVAINGGSYTVGSDNRGTLTLNTADGDLTFDFALGGTSPAVATVGDIISTSLMLGDAASDALVSHVVATGQLKRQDPSAFSLSAIAGARAFGRTGACSIPLGTTGSQRFAAAGSFTLDTSGNISNGSSDTNCNGQPSSSSAWTGTLSAPDPNGRAVASVNGSNFAVYVVGADESFVISTDPFSNSTPIQAGITKRQANPGMITGTSVLWGEGVSQCSNYSGTTLGAGLLAVTSGGGSTGSFSLPLEGNDCGSYQSLSTINGTYNVDPNTGRMTLGMGGGPAFGGSAPVFYLVGPNEGFMVGTDNVNVWSGYFQPQVGGPFTNASLSGNSIFGNSAPPVGTSLISGVGTADGNGNINGTGDLTKYAAAAMPNLTLTQPIQVTYSVATNGRVFLPANTDPSQAAAQKLQYIISPTMEVMLDLNSGSNPELSIVRGGQLSVATISLPPGMQGATYNTVLQATGGTGPYNWSLVNNTVLPAGLTLSGNTITSGAGTVQAPPGIYNFTVQVTDSGSPQQTATANLSITINGAGVATLINIATGTSPQSTNVNTAFSVPLTVVVTDSNNNPVSGATVNFSAPASGATAALSSATVTTGANGQASVTATANNVTGSYNVVATVAGTSLSTIFSLTNNASGYQVSGYVSLNSDGSPVPGLMVMLSGGGVYQTTNTANDGSYSLTGLPNGTYSVSLYSNTTQNFISYPISQSVTINGSSVNNVNFGVALGYTVSGTVSYSGNQTKGWVYVSLQNTNGSNGSTPGTAIDLGTGTTNFTIQGVPPGTYTLVAWMDILNCGGLPCGVQNASSPAGALPNVAVSVSGPNVTNLSVALTDPTAPSISALAPTIQGVIPVDQGAIVMFKPIVQGGASGSASGPALDAATSYVLQWSTDNFTTVGGTQTFPGTGSKMPVFITGLTDGTGYYFRIRGQNSSGTSLWSSISGPVTINALSGANTVSGSVTFTGTANGPLYVGCHDGNTGKVYAATYPRPVSPVTYSVAGIPTGANCYMFGIVDQNSDGMVDAGDIQNTNSNGNNTIPISGNATANITLPSGNAIASVTTQHSRWVDQNNSNQDNYSLNFEVDELLKLPVAVELQQPESPNNVLAPADIALSSNNKAGQFQSWQNVGSVSPTAGSDYYTLAVTYSDGTTDYIKVTVNTVLNAFATGMLPSGPGAGTMPNFSWTDPSNASNYTYQFQLTDTSNNSWNTIWQIPGQNSQSNGFGSSITSIPWNTDPSGGGSLPIQNPLSGTSYQWSITTQDSSGNSAQMQVQFTP